MMVDASFSYSGTELDALAEAKNYYRWILSYFAPYMGKRVIEVGAGIGTFSEFLLNSANVSELVLFEPTDNLFPQLQNRFSGNIRVKLLHGYLEDLINTTNLSADSIVLVNVLEHIENDEAFLKAAYQILISEGTILLFVPALPQLYGALDEAVGHYRRYTKPSLASKLQKVGFHIVCLRYFNFPGIFTWFLAGRVMRYKTLRFSDVRFYDRWIVPYVSRLEKYWEPPIGQNLVAIAKK
jgi:SAM-dependent methyltransferase